MLVVYQRGKKKFAQGATLTSAGSGVSGERVEVQVEGCCQQAAVGMLPPSSFSGAQQVGCGPNLSHGNYVFCPRQLCPRPARCSTCCPPSACLQDDTVAFNVDLAVKGDITVAMWFSVGGRAGRGGGGATLFDPGAGGVIKGVE